MSTDIGVWGRQGLGLSSTARSSAPPSVLVDFEVWIDPIAGSRGTDTVTIALDGLASDAGSYWDLGATADGVCVDGYGGELTVDPTTTIGAAGNEIIRGFLVCDMGTQSGGSSSRRIWSNKVAAGSNDAGIHIAEFSADVFFPDINVSDGATNDTTAAHATDIAGAGRVMVLWDLFTAFGFEFSRVNVVTSAGIQTPVTDVLGAISSFEIPHDGMVFGAACSSATGGPGGGPSASNGPNGGTFHVYAGGFDRSQNEMWTDDAAVAIARYYGVV